MAVGFVTTPRHVDHGVERHPECPERLEAVLTLLEESGLLDRVTRLEPRDATDEELSWVHAPAFVQALDEACRSGGGWADPDTYILSGSCAAARQAAGACLEGRGYSVR